jgi:hypothetical protein
MRIEISLIASLIGAPYPFGDFDVALKDDRRPGP